ncbi:hypothetical protein TRFO_06090 [Tritrichomonas foetus]|uniref:Uncharacterized protein n=1 Tax=Tritrichomonas foetus TaxID=1144522 RepID=A0A1J4K6L0_9EUKA|nr:hypothetical protein TRFO_06090 [Tritrichomonas foetus]|eukprot:OHT05085.1 hypothetical protein TRFO_06090 [Tritrichomonas foetus]
MEKYQNQFLGKNEQLISDLKNYINTSTETHESKIQSIEQEKENLKNLLKSVIEGSQARQTNFMKNIEATKADLADRINQAKQKYQAERNNHFVEAEKRMQQCRHDSEEKIRKLKEEHAQKLAQLRSEGKISVKIDNSKIEAGIERMRAAAALLIGHKNKLIGLKETTAKCLKDNKSKIDKEIQEIMKIKKENDELLSKMDQQIDEIERPNKEMLEQLIQQQKDQKINFSNEYQKKFDDFEKLKEELFKEYENLKLLNKDSLSKLNALFSDLTKQHETEIGNLTKKHADIQAMLEENQKKLKKEISKAKKQHKKAKLDITNELNELKKKHEVEKDELGHILFQERTTKLSEYDNAIKKMKSDISAAMGDDKKKEMKARDELESLEDNKTNLIANHQTEMKKIEGDEEDELEKLKKEFENKRNQLNSQISSSLEDLERENHDKINNAKSLNMNKKEDFINKLNSLNSEELSKIKQNGFSKDEFNSLEKKFQDDLNHLQKELNLIQPPKLEDNEKYRSLTKLIDDLEKELGLHTKNNQNEQDSLMKNWQSQEDSENERHKQVLRPTSSGRNRDQAKIALMKKLEDMRKLKEEEISRLSKLLEDLIQSHTKEMENLEKEKIEAQQQEKIDRLQDQLENEEIDSKRRIDSLLESFKLKLNSKNKEIEEKTNRFNTEINNSKSKIDEIVAQFESTKNELNSQIDSILQKSQNNLDSEARKFEKDQNGMINDHNLQTHNLGQEIDSFKHNIPLQKQKNEKQLQENSSQRQNEIDEYVRKVKKEIEDIKVHWKGMEEFFEERIAVLINERNKWINMFETRPSRQCDIEQIEYLSNHLKMIQSQLTLALKDYTQFKAIYVEQDKKYNAMFGKNPKVGILQFGNLNTPRATRV